MSQTIIGNSLVVDGEITSEEELVVQGTVKGRITLKGDVQVESSGVVDADIEANTLTVAGQVKGSVIATERLEIGPEAKLIGNIKTSRIHIADGAVFKGTVDMDV